GWDTGEWIAALGLALVDARRAYRTLLLPSMLCCTTVFGLTSPCATLNTSRRVHPWSSSTTVPKASRAVRQTFALGGSPPFAASLRQVRHFPSSTSRTQTCRAQELHAARCPSHAGLSHTGQGRVPVIEKVTPSTWQRLRCDSHPICPGRSVSAAR